MISVPVDFAGSTIRREGEAGRSWTERLPGLFESLCRRWNLHLDGAPMCGGLGVAVPVRRAEELLVLKVGWIDESTEHEALALALWNGRGAVRLFEADSDAGALLLERLDSHRCLSGVELDQAVATAGRLLRRLAIPGPETIPKLSDIAKSLSESLPLRWERLGRPMPRRLIDRACETAASLGPSAGSLLVNYDLHYDDVLAGEREPWLAVDPKVVVGDAEYGIAQLLWRRMEEMEARGGLGRYFQLLAESADLDTERARAWTLVRCVDYWLWGLSVGLTEDPARCEVILDRIG